MRLLVVPGSPPASSFSTEPWRRMAPQPPGPGFPLHAPSVKISTSAGARAGLSGVDAISGGAGHGAVKPQPLPEFDRLLGVQQPPPGLLQPIVAPGQPATQAAAT